MNMIFRLKNEHLNTELPRSATLTGGLAHKIRMEIMLHRWKMYNTNGKYIPRPVTQNYTIDRKYATDKNNTISQKSKIHMNI
jgi:hypothetical protein